MKTNAYAFRHDGETIAIGNGYSLKVETPRDEHMGPPWEEHDGHGVVSDWTTRDKRAGELLLHSDGSHRRYYDIAESAKIARRDGWGFLPHKLETVQDSGLWFANAGPFRVGPFADVNEAVRAVYAAHRATFRSDREYAAAAARSDFEQLKDWCEDRWHWIGVCVSLIDPDGEEVAQDSIWGVESFTDYWQELAAEIAESLVSQHAKRIAANTDAESLRLAESL